MEIMGLFTGLFALIFSIMLIIAPLAIWSECRQIRKMLKEQSTTRNVWQECYNLRKQLKTVIELLQGDEREEEPR